ncbi:MAG: sulfatase [Puniceicoccaceae bacterium]|nr:sulfatase [Puniceicoccaceae bacterium]MBL6920371.1 sulfatase [Puniceicoccaceae bacterium]
MNATALLSLLTVSLCCAQAAEPPNVLFIAVDDLVPTLGCYGDPLAKTPAIDRLAAQGTTFLNHHVQWSVCGPSRAALTTSLMPEETGVMGFKPIRGVLPNVVTLPQYFRENGYETAASGKFHDNRTVGDPSLSPDDQGYLPNGKELDDPASWSIPYNDGGGKGYNPSGRKAVDYANANPTEFIDYDINRRGLELLDRISEGTRPFFLAVGFKKPHLAFIAPKPFWDLYDTNGNGRYDDDFPLPEFNAHPTGATAALVDVLGNNKELLGYMPYKKTGMPTESEIRELRHGYYACVSFVDSLVDALLLKLQTTPDPVQSDKMMSETTIVVLWGDHGFYLGNHDRWAKHSLTERATAAPLIIYDPRMSQGGTKSVSPVESIDLYPTLCELAGLPIPEQPADAGSVSGRPLRGVSVVPVLKDPSASVKGGAISNFRGSGTMGYSYRTERYRYIEWIQGKRIVQQDLYELRPGSVETVNIATNPENAALLQRLSKELHAAPQAQGMSVLQDTPVL